LTPLGRVVQLLPIGQKIFRFMIRFAHLVDRITHFLHPVLVVAAIGFWILALIGEVRRRRGRQSNESKYSLPPGLLLFVGFSGFVGIIGFEFATAAFVKSAALREIQPILAERPLSVLVNGRPTAHSAELTDALRTISDPTRHHSHPTESFQVQIVTARNSLTLELERDSQDAREFWVFYPGFNMIEVGHAFTDVFPANAEQGNSPTKGSSR